METIHAPIPANIADTDRLTVAVAQIAPVWLNRQATTQKIVEAVTLAADEGASLVAFGEAVLPGYPFWVERTDGARFESDVQKAWYARYLDEAVSVERGDLAPIQEIAKARLISVYLGFMERAADRGGHTVYCTLGYIDRDGVLQSTHRKLQPTYEERLVWGMGDGHGLVTHALDSFTVGALNCWENWLPLARASLYAQGEDLHVAAWPGGQHNTETLTPVLAQEGRSYVLSASGLMRPHDVPEGLPGYTKVRGDGETPLANGGSCIAAPDGTFLVPPVVDREALIVATLDHARVRRSRLTLDTAGHYSRPDVLSLTVDRRRKSTVSFTD